MSHLVEQRRIVAEMDAEAAKLEALRGLIPRFEAKIQRVLDHGWGNGAEATEKFSKALRLVIIYS